MAIRWGLIRVSGIHMTPWIRNLSRWDVTNLERNSWQPKCLKFRFYNLIVFHFQGKSYLLMCETRGIPKPLPEIKWYKNDKRVRNSRHFYIIVSFTLHLPFPMAVFLSSHYLPEFAEEIHIQNTIAEKNKKWSSKEKEEEREKKKKKEEESSSITNK